MVDIIKIGIGLVLLGFIVFLWWKDPYRIKAKKIMGSDRRRTDHFNRVQRQHHVEPPRSSTT